MDAVDELSVFNPVFVASARSKIILFTKKNLPPYGTGSDKLSYLGRKNLVRISFLSLYTCKIPLSK